MASTLKCLALIAIASHFSSYLVATSPTTAQPRNAKVELKRLAAEEKPTPTSRKLETERNRFQARMMKASEQQFSAPLSSSDAWHPHNIMPTFTDQEQGDEMVALASDIEPEPVKLSPPSNKSSASTLDQADQTKATPIVRANQRNKERQQMVDEYYNDEDDADEDEQQQQQSNNSNKQPSQADLEDRKESQKFRPITNQYGAESSANFEEQLNQRQFESKVNKSAPAQDGAWQPSSSRPRVYNYQRSGPGEKLAEMFGGRAEVFSVHGGGSLVSKADMAIEYLKNVLKDKQQQQGNSSSVSDAVNKDQERGSSLHRLSSFASRLNQPQQQQFVNGSSKGDIGKAPEKQFAMPEKSFLVSQSDTKFSISDVRQTSMYPMTTTTTTTKLPAEPIYTKSQLADNFSPLEMGAANGTPLGGDYSENLDDFPRNLNQRQHHLLGAESHQSPIHLARDSISVESSQVHHQKQKQPQAQSSFNLEQSSYFQAQPLPQVAAEQHQQSQQQNRTERLAMKKEEQQAGKKSKPEQQQQPISSKLYKESEQPIHDSLFKPQQQIYQPAPMMNNEQASMSTQHLARQTPRPPKIVSYNYFETSPEASGAEPSSVGELIATNYQLGDALYSSSGGLEQSLSNVELEAIQNQFLTAEHPIVPLPPDAQTQQQQQANNFNPYQETNLAGLLANFKSDQFSPDALQKLSSPNKQAEDVLKELASNQEDQLSIVAPPSINRHQPIPFNMNRPVIDRQHVPIQENPKRFNERDAVNSDGKKKSLIVYLNHPRPVDMSKNNNNEHGYNNLAHSINDQPISGPESFVSAKEFDSHGLSKETKHIDISNLHGLGDIKEGQDKDGLSVVVIGDAYKYKKIVLLISSKTGGLKFIPMVKDMKKK